MASNSFVITAEDSVTAILKTIHLVNFLYIHLYPVIFWNCSEIEDSMS